jgi:hydrogenase maturation factor
VATGIHELACASGTGAIVHESRITVLPEGARLCEAYGLDPLGCIASGALLIAMDPLHAGELLAIYENEGIPCAEIGHLVAPEAGVTILRGDAQEPLPRYDVDEIARLF